MSATPILSPTPPATLTLGSQSDASPRSGVGSVKRAHSGGGTPKRQKENSQEDLLREKISDFCSRALRIKDELFELPLDKVAGFTLTLQERSRYAQRLFQAIHAYKEAQPTEGGRTNSDLADSSIPSSMTDEVDSDEPSRLSLEKRQRFDKLVSALDQLFDKLARTLSATRKLLNIENQKKELDLLAERECNLHSHYRDKISELQTLKPPKKVTSLVRDPSSPTSFGRVAKIRDHALYQQYRTVIDPFLDEAALILDFERRAANESQAIKQRLALYTEIHRSNLQRLVRTKNNKLYRDDEHANNHLQKVSELCFDQQNRLYVEPNIFWDAKPAPQPFTIECQEVLCGTYQVAVSLHQGRRDHMEDKSLVCKMRDFGKGELPLFAVMDGHGGDKAAQHCKQHLATIFADELERFNGIEFTVSGICNAGRRTCLELHERFRTESGGIIPSGTTLVFATIIGRTVYAFSVADSRVVLFVGDTVIALSYDNSTKEEASREKAKRNGGIVAQDLKRVFRVAPLGLNVTTSIGDRLHDAIFTRYPMICAHELPDDTTEPVYLLLYSDGLSGVASDMQLHEAVIHAEKGASVGDINRSIMERALRASGDNVTLVLVKLRD